MIEKHQIYAFIFIVFYIINHSITHYGESSNA